MKNKDRNYLTILGPSGWKGGRVLVHYKCLCGRKGQMEIHRTKKSSKNRAYKSCGCLRDSNSITYWYERRWKFFEKIKKEKDHWIYKSSSSSDIPKCSFNNSQSSIWRVAYMYWNHLKTLPEGILIDNICGNKYCVKPTHIRKMNWGDKSREKWMKRNASNKQL